MIGVSTSPFQLFLTRRLNTWYSVKDGNWSDPNTWVSNGLDKKSYFYPQPGDSVYINHSVSFDYTANGNINNWTINNLFGTGLLTFGSSNPITLTITGYINFNGTIDHSGTQSHNLILLGENNYLSSYSGGTLGTITYSCTGPWQVIMLLTHNNVSCPAGTTKVIKGDTTISGAITLSGGVTLELDLFNFTVNGALNLSGCTIKRTPTSTGALLKTTGTITSGTNNTINLGTTNDWEMQGTYKAVTETFTLRTLIISANQSWTGNGNGRITTINGNVQINSGITLNLSNESCQIVMNTGVINGVSGTSTLSNSSALIFPNSANTVAMATGVLTMTSTASVGYTFNGNFTIPFTSLNNLIVSGTGTKTLSGDTILNGFVRVSSTTLELSTFNFTVTGISNTFISSSAGLLANATILRTPTSTGSLLKFIGQQLNSTSTATINVGSTNDIELQSGALFTNDIYTCRNLNLTTTQSFVDASTSHAITISGNIVISNSCVITLSSGGILLSGTLNGSNATSQFTNLGTFTYNNATAPMVTGKLYCNQAANTFVYGLAGNQDITVPADPVSPGYQNLTLQGSGAKKLLGNVSVKGVYTLTGPATLNSNGFSLTNP